MWPHNLASGFRSPLATVVSAEPFSHGTGTLRCLQKEMATYRHWSVSLWRDPDDVSHCQILSPDKTEWWLISATLCRWRCCFVADQLWFMTRIREEGKYRAISEWQKLWACVKGNILTALRTLVVTFEIAHCSNWNSVCLKDLTFQWQNICNYSIRKQVKVGLFVQVYMCKFTAITYHQYGYWWVLGFSSLR